jgi:hypothetical protein
VGLGMFLAQPWFIENCHYNPLKIGSKCMFRSREESAARMQFIYPMGCVWKASIFYLSITVDLFEVNQMRIHANSNLNLIANKSLLTIKLPIACRRKLKMSLKEKGVFSRVAVLRQTGLEKNAVDAWLNMFRRAVPITKHDKYLADVDINDSVSLLYYNILWGFFC